MSKAVALALALLAAAAPAGAVFCAKRSGQIVSRAAGCKKNQTQLTVVGPQGTPGDTGNPGGPGGGRLANGAGQVIGALDPQEDGEYAVVRSPLDGTMLQVAVGVGGFRDDDSVTLYHDLLNCNGDTFYPVTSTASLVHRATQHGGMIYYAADPIDPMEQQFRSFETPKASCQPSETVTPRGFCCTTLALKALAGPARSLDVATFGTPPFKVLP